MSLFTYSATAVLVHDGDTLKADIDLGFHVHAVEWIRLAHINAPELHEARGQEARTRLVELTRGPLVITTTRDRTEKYGRFLA